MGHYPIGARRRLRARPKKPRATRATITPAVPREEVAGAGCAQMPGAPGLLHSPVKHRWLQQTPSTQKPD